MQLQAPVVSKKNKVRTNLIILAHDDIKSTKKHSVTMINSKNLNDFEKEFDGMVVRLKDVTYVSTGDFKEEKNNRKSLELNDLWLSKGACNVDGNINIKGSHNGINYEYIDDSTLDYLSNENIKKKRTEKKDKAFCSAERKFSISQKKMKHFNDFVLKKHMVEVVEDEYENLRRNSENDKLSKIEKVIHDSVRRKFSKIRMREKLLSNNKGKSTLFEAAGKAFDYLQKISKNYKLEENQDFQDKPYHKARYSKSCGKKEIKILADLMKNLSENYINKSSLMTKDHFYLKDFIEESEVTQSAVNNYNHPIGVGVGIEIEQLNLDSIHNPISRVNPINAKVNNETKPFHTVYSLTNRNNPLSNDGRDFKINIIKCSSASSSITENNENSVSRVSVSAMSVASAVSEFTPKSSAKDFTITLKNCRKSCEYFDKESRRMSEITPPSSVYTEGENV